MRTQEFTRLLFSLSLILTKELHSWSVQEGPERLLELLCHLSERISSLCFCGYPAHTGSLAHVVVIVPRGGVPDADDVDCAPLFLHIGALGVDGVV